MPIGNPISLTNNVATATLVVSATQDQTAFTVTGGYRINKLGVFRNGVRLNASDDFIALDGATVTLIEPCSADDEIVFEVQDDFRVADAIVSAASTQTISGNLVVTGELYPAQITLTQINASGVITATSFDGDLSGNATTATTAGGLSGTPELTVSTITGVAATFTGNVTIGGTLTYEDVTNIDSVGVITARNGIVVNNNGINVSSGIVSASSFDATDFVSVANSIRHRGDANTTIGFAGNDEIELVTNGLDRLSIKSNGNVVLDNFSSTSGRGKLAFGNSTQWFIESLDANAGGDARFTINEGSDEFLRIDTAGDVGIGTNNPLDKLHLFNETSSGLRLEVPQGIALLSMVQANNNIANGTVAGDLAIRGQSGISLSPDNGSSVAARLLSDGSLSVGHTGAPTSGASNQSNFNVVGNVGSATGDAQLNLWRRSDPTSGQVLGQISFCGDESGDPGAVIKAEADASWNQGGDTSDHPSRFVFETVPDNSSVPVERMRIDRDGNVTIGPTLSNLGKLHVRAADECNFVVREEATSLILSAETNSGRDNNRQMNLEGNGVTVTSSGTERFRVTGGGNVGIQTNNPTGPNALTNNNATLAVGIVTANFLHGDGSALTNLPSTGGFDAGTVMLFRQTNAPTGWTKDTSNNNGSALRVVTGSATTGGTDSFGTVFGTSKTTASHTLTIAQIPAHTHTGGMAGSGSFTTGGFNGGNTGSTGGGQGHSHNLSNMDLKFTDVIQASKD